MEISSLLEIWSYLTWLHDWFLKRIFTEQRLADLVIVDIRPRHDYATTDLGPIAKFELWFQVINMSPFEVELDRAEIRFTCAGTSLETRYIKRTTFKAGEIAEFHVEGDIPEGKANQIAQHHNNNASWITMDMDFNYDKVIELNPLYPGAYHNRGIAKRESGDEAGANEDSAKANALIEIQNRQLPEP